MAWVVLLMSSLGQTLVAPQPLDTSPPPPPAELAAVREDVTVVLMLSIDAGGQVTDVSVTQSGGAAFDGAASEAARAWRFVPATRDGVPIAAELAVPVTFAKPVPESAPNAAEPPPPATPPPSSDPAYETIVRHRGQKAPLAAGDFSISVGQLHDVPRRSATDLLQLAPTVMLTNVGGEGHAKTIYVRGMDAGEGKDLELSVEGVPLNEVSNAHGHGYADTYFIMPELVRTLRVVEGPFDPAQGDFAVAGSAEYELGLEQRGVRASVGAGNFGARRLALTWGPRDAGPGTFVGVLARRGSGFGANRAYSNIGVMAQLDETIAGDVRLRAFAASYGARFSSAGVIREDDLRRDALPCGPGDDEQFFCTYDRNQGGAVQRHIASLRVSLKRTYTLEQQAYVHLRRMRIRESFTGFLNDLPPAGESQRGDLLELGYGGTTLGLRGRYVPGAALWNVDDPLVIGYSARFDDVETRSRRLRASNGAPYAQLFDNDVRVTNIAPYVRLHARPWPWLVLRGGLRLDAFAFAVTDRNRPAADRDGARLTDDASEAYGYVFNPRGTVELRLRPELSLMASAGTGARSSDAAALSDAELAPFARVTATEVGARYHLGFDATELEVRAAAFATRIERDLVFDEVAGRNQPVGPSHRLGSFVAARLGYADALDLLVTASYTRAHLPGADSDFFDFARGPDLPYVPRVLARADVSFRDAFTFMEERIGWNIASGLGFIGPKPLPLNRFSQRIFLVDLAARLSVRALELGLVVENLFDARWREAEFNYASNFRGADEPPSLVAMRHFSVGAPRSFLVTAAITWGAE